MRPVRAPNWELGPIREKGLDLAESPPSALGSCSCGWLRPWPADKGLNDGAGGGGGWSGGARGGGTEVARVSYLPDMRQPADTPGDLGGLGQGPRRVALGRFKRSRGGPGRGLQSGEGWGAPALALQAPRLSLPGAASARESLVGGSALAEAWLKKGVGSEPHCLSGPCRQSWRRSDLCLAKGPWELGARSGCPPVQATGRGPTSDA